MPILRTTVAIDFNDEALVVVPRALVLSRVSALVGAQAHGGSAAITIFLLQRLIEIPVRVAAGPCGNGRLHQQVHQIGGEAAVQTFFVVAVNGIQRAVKRGRVVRQNLIARRLRMDSVL